MLYNGPSALVHRLRTTTLFNKKKITCNNPAHFKGELMHSWFYSNYNGQLQWSIIMVGYNGQLQWSITISLKVNYT